MNTILTVQLEDLDDNPPEFEFEEKTRDPLSGSGVAGRGRPSWDGGGRRTVKDAGRKLFFRYVRFKDGGGPRTDKISSKEDGGGRRTNPLRPPQGRIRTSDGQNF